MCELFWDTAREYKTVRLVKMITLQINKWPMIQTFMGLWALDYHRVFSYTEVTR